jgi:hypothetical protein
MEEAKMLDFSGFLHIKMPGKPIFFKKPPLIKRSGV